MVRCPQCQSDLSRLPAIPQQCPECGQCLEGQVGDDDNDPGTNLGSGEFDVSIVDRTASSGEFSWQDGSSGAAPNAADDPGKTVQSDEFEAVDVDRTVQSEDSSWTNDLSPASPNATVESDPAVDSEVVDPGANDRTVQSDEFSWQQDPAGAPPTSAGDATRTVAKDDFNAARGDQTMQSDEFALSDADMRGGLPADPGSDRTVMSDEWSSPGADQTMLSDELPPDAVKTMQTLWSGAVQGPTHPGMSIKGANLGPAGSGSTLVIKQRRLSTLGESPVANKDTEYELIRVLGEGGMGVVYDARQTSVDRSVAIKMLKPRTSSDERQQQKFLAEAVVTGDLDHPNIVPIYDVGKSEHGLLFYAMKKVKGTPWMKLLPQKSQTENL